MSELFGSNNKQKQVSFVAEDKTDFNDLGFYRNVFARGKLNRIVGCYLERVVRCLQPIYKHLLVGMQIRQLSWILIDLFTRLITCDRAQCRSTSLHYTRKVHAYYASIKLFIFPKHLSSTYMF